MNKVSRLGVRLLSACVIAAASGLAGAQATFVKAQALEVFVDHHEGVVNCQGSATPTGNFFLPCGPEISGTIRGRQVFARVVSSDPRFTGNNTIVANINFDRHGQGPIWGTFTLVLDAGGVFEGPYSGTIDVTNLTMDAEGVGHGQGGIAEGLRVKVDDVHQTPFDPRGSVGIRLLIPGGKP